ncbi:YceD family protein [Candidatus Proelusimicrobium volucris]|uniref:YceD family protein n=1 Tax=Candidatus Proelusimicrobium volucris TaxID=3416225 RepID=UPI003D0E4E17
MKYSEYEIPSDLVFKTKDIIDMGGLKCSALLNPSDFADCEEFAGKIKRIETKLSFSVLSKDIMVNGEVCGKSEVECSRCLKEFEKSFNEKFSQLYSTKSEIIDIMYLIRQTLALLGGIQNLCSKECKGLCPYCGCDRNEVQCDCKEPSFSQFACLKEKISKK